MKNSHLYGKRIKRVLLLCVAALLFLQAFGATSALAAGTDNIAFTDANLKSALLAALGKDSDDEITQDELAAYTGAAETPGLLNLSGKLLTDLEGLQYAAGVTAMNLSGNQIRSLTPIMGLTEVLTLDVSGNYLVLTEGGADITDINTLIASGCAVTYQPQIPIPALSVALDKTAINLCPGDTTLLTATVTPADAANPAVTWTSSNPAAVSVTGGALTAGAVGTATITATPADGGIAASCTVNVQANKLVSTSYLVSTPVILGVAKNTTVAQLKANMSNAAEDMYVLDSAGALYTGEMVGTGMTLQLIVAGIVRDSLTVVVNGDINGDGSVSIGDYTMTRLHILQLKKLTGIVFTASDLNGDGKITIRDYTIMRLSILGITPGSGDVLDLPAVSNPRIRAFLDLALGQQNKPYVWGAEGPDAFDCSGLIHYCLVNSGYAVGRTTADKYSRFSSWAYVDKSALQPGDLMFYFSDSTTDGDRIGHVGIYLGNGYHIHASSDNGYIIISRVEGWYARMLSHGRRVF